MKEAIYIELDAGVRYWEDGKINGVEDINGDMPCRKGDGWCPIIDLKNGKIINWTQGIEANIHYKVCDSGFYWILNEEKQRIAKWKDFYVPNNILCTKSNGYGDYIIFDIESDGKITNWCPPYIDEDEWESMSGDID